MGQVLDDWRVWHLLSWFPLLKSHVWLVVQSSQFSDLPNYIDKAACKRTQQLSTLLRQQCWVLLRAGWQWCANGCINFQQVWDLQCIVGRIQPIGLCNPCVISVRGPYNVGRTVQTDPTLLRYASAITEQKKCWELLAEKFDRFQTLRNNSQQQGVQTDATCNIQQCWELLANNVTSVCTGLKCTSHLKQLGKNTPARIHTTTQEPWPSKIIFPTRCRRKLKRKTQGYPTNKFFQTGKKYLKGISLCFTKLRLHFRGRFLFKPKFSDAVSIVGKEMFTPKYTFDGSFGANAVPPSSVFLVNMILYGPNIEIQASTLTKCQAGLTISQLLQYNSYHRRPTNKSSSSGTH